MLLHRFDPAYGPGASPQAPALPLRVICLLDSLDPKLSARAALPSAFSSSSFNPLCTGTPALLTKQRGHGVARVAKPCSQLSPSGPCVVRSCSRRPRSTPARGEEAAAAARRVTPASSPVGGRPERAGWKDAEGRRRPHGERSGSQPFAARRTRRCGRAARTRRLPPPSRAPLQSTPVTRGGARAGALRPALRRSSQSPTSPGLPPRAGHRPSPRAQRTS
jgi:hypothetical protein